VAVIGRLAKVRVLGHKVGLGGEFHQHTGDRAVGLVMYVGPDGALIGLSISGPLGHLGKALDAESVDGLVEVAIGLDQRLLGIHHSHARDLAQLLDLLGGYLSHW
jgi:hypothetical protein